MSPSDPFQEGKQQAASGRSEIQRLRSELIKTFSSEKSRLEGLARKVRSKSEASGYSVTVTDGFVGDMDFYLDDEKIRPPVIYIRYAKYVHRNSDGKTEIKEGGYVGEYWAGRWTSKADYSGREYQPASDADILRKIGYTLEQNKPQFEENIRKVKEAGVGCLIFMAVPLGGLAFFVAGLLT